MSRTKPKFMRRNYIVHKGFQLRFAVAIFIVTFIVSVIAVWTTYVTTWNEVANQVQTKRFYNRIQSVYDKGVDEDSSVAMLNSVITVEFSEIFDRVSSALILRLLVGALAIFILSIFASHKIAGPIHRIKNAAHSIRDGDLSVDLGSLRAGDELIELAQAVDEAVAKLRKLLGRYRERAQKLSEIAAKMSEQKKTKAGVSAEYLQLMNELEIISSQLVTEMNYFGTKKSKHDNEEQNSRKQKRERA